MRVLLQAHCMAEGFAADVAGEGPGPTVGAADVHLEPMWGGEHLQEGQSMRPRGAERERSRGPTCAPSSAIGGRTGEGTLDCRFCCHVLCVLGRSLSLSVAGFLVYRMESGTGDLESPSWPYLEAEWWLKSESWAEPGLNAGCDIYLLRAIGQVTQRL